MEPKWFEALEAYLEWMRLERRSADLISCRRYALTRYLEETGGPGDRLAALKYLDRFENPRTRATAWGHIRGFVQHLAERGLCEDFSRKIRMRQRRHSRHNTVTAGEIKAMLDACDRQSWAGLRDYTLLTMYLQSSARRDEIRCLRLEDVDLEGMQFRAKVKGGDVESFHLTPTAASALERWIPRVEGRYLFRGQRKRQDRPMSRSTVRDIVNRVARAAGIRRHIHPHAFRHTAAQTLLDAGNPLEIVQLVLHHRSIQSTQIYAHASEQKAARAMDEDLVA